MAFRLDPSTIVTQGGGIRPRHTSGRRYWAPQFGSLVAGNWTPAINQLTYNPVYLTGTPLRFDRVGVVVNTIGGAGSVVRLGLYREETGTGGRPGALVTDFGTVDSTIAGLREITISEPVPDAGLYFLAHVSQVAIPVLRNYAQLVPLVNQEVLDAESLVFMNIAYLQNGVTGALPDPAVPSTTVWQDDSALVYFRIA